MLWHHDLWSTTVRSRVTVRLRISTSPLFALFTCCWMSFEAVLGNKEFLFLEIRTVVLQRSWYQMPGCSVQCKMNKNTHGYMTVWCTKGVYVSFVNCFVVILPHHKNVLLLALTLVQYDCYSITGLELPLSVRGVGRRTQPIRKLLNDLLITSALNSTCLLQSALNPTLLLQVNDFPTHLYLGSVILIFGKISS
jgi:hypothetical protein